MTGGQTSLAFSADNESGGEENVQAIQRIARPQSGLRVVYATDEEISEHEARLDLAEKKGANPCIWRS